MRKLASIKIINDIRPIEGKDRIELAIVDGWSVIVKKDEFLKSLPKEICLLCPNLSDSNS